METEKLEIKGLMLLKPRLFEDERGVFTESFHEEKYKEILGDFSFKQDNQSVSKLNVLRGLHFQSPPFDQGKLVHVAHGSVLDIAVDIRKSSSTYGQYVAVQLDAINKWQFWIPPGFAHGFVALEEDTVFCYKCTNYYAPTHEHTILWNDQDLQINWGTDAALVSQKDKEGLLFNQFKSPF